MFTQMLKLPTPLSIMQNQSIECSLQIESSDSEMDEKLKELVEKVIIVKVEEIDNNRYQTNILISLSLLLLKLQSWIHNALNVFVFSDFSCDYMIFKAFEYPLHRKKLKIKFPSYVLCQF